MDQPSVRICFAYTHEYRLVEATRVWQSKEGNWLISGVDVDKDEFRTFRADRIQNTIRFV